MRLSSTIIRDVMLLADFPTMPNPNYDNTPASVDVESKDPGSGTECREHCSSPGGIVRAATHSRESFERCAAALIQEAAAFFIATRCLAARSWSKRSMSAIDSGKHTTVATAQCFRLPGRQTLR